MVDLLEAIVIVIVFDSFVTFILSTNNREKLCGFRNADNKLQIGMHDCTVKHGGK